MGASPLPATAPSPCGSHIGRSRWPTAPSGAPNVARRWKYDAHDAVCCEIAPAPCKPDAPIYGHDRENPGHARPLRVVSPGSIVSRRGLLQDGLIQFGFGQQLLELDVLLLQLFHSLRLVHAETAIFPPPADQRLFRYADLLRRQFLSTPLRD